MTPEDQAKSLLPTLLALEGPRKLIAISGPPGAGKSTLAEALEVEIAALGRSVAVIPMDGFHLDNRLLEPRGILARKGSPQSFDAAGFVELVSRIADGQDVIYPVFDRDRDIAIAGASHLPADTEFVLFEGNYLLLKDEPWARLSAFWQFSVMTDPGLETLKARLLDRWLEQGLARTDARARRDQNDLPNALYVRENSQAADLMVAD